MAPPQEPDPPIATRIRRRIALRVASIYLIAALAWIVASDLLLFEVIPDAGALAGGSIAKGILFVAVTSIILYAVILRSARNLESRVEVSWREIDERYRALFERSLDCVFLVDPKGNFLDANRAALDLLGYRREEISSIDLARLLSAEQLPRALGAIEEVMSTGTLRAPREYTVRRKDGGQVIVETTASLVYAGDVPGVILGIARDVTERRRADSDKLERLERERSQVAAVATVSTSDALFAGDVERLAREITEQAARVTGVERANVWLFNEDETELRCIDLYEATAGKHTAGAALRKAQFANEFRALREARYVAADDAVADPRTAGYADGYLKPLRITSMLDAVVKLPDKHLGLLCLEHVDQPHRWRQDEIAFACQFADKIALCIAIRARGRAQAELADSEQRLRAMVEQSISGFYMIQDDRFIYVNARFAEIFGYPSPSEILGKGPMDLTAPKDRSTVRTNIERRLAGEVKSLSYSFTGLRKDGTEIDVGAHGSYAVYRGRAVIMGLLQDISERSRTQAEIQHYVERLKQTMQSTIDVVAAMSEVRDPYTHGHERRVGEIAAAIAAEMGLPADQVEGIRIAGYLHDVGKMAVPAEILSKPSRLTRAEYELVKDHAQQSYDLLRRVPFPWPVAETAWQHHERLDGSGYPQALKGDAIRLEARVLAVADTVEAMASHRPYRPGLGIEHALTEIEANRGKLYDPYAADACLRLFREKGYALPA